VEEILKIKFTVSAKEDINDEFGKIAIDYEGTSQEEERISISKKKWYHIKKIASR